MWVGRMSAVMVSVDVGTDCNGAYTAWEFDVTMCHVNWVTVAVIATIIASQVIQAALWIKRRGWHGARRPVLQCFLRVIFGPLFVTVELWMNAAQLREWAVQRLEAKE
eukprot:gene1865-39924_t